MCAYANDPNINSKDYYEAMQIRNCVDFMTEDLANIQKDQWSNLEILCEIYHSCNTKNHVVLAKSLSKTRIMYLLQDRLDKYNANQFHAQSREYEELKMCLVLFINFCDCYETLCVELFNNKALINLMMDVMLKLDINNWDESYIFFALLNILHNISRREPCLGRIKINDSLKQKIIKLYHILDDKTLKAVPWMLLLETDCSVDISLIAQYREIFDTIFKALDEASKTEDNYYKEFSAAELVNMVILMWDKLILRDEIRQNKTIKNALDKLWRKDYCIETVSKLRDRLANE